MAPVLPSARVLSVQSHVVRGYCGNKSATFPLQLLEFEVDAVNSVQLSNHTGYNIARGQIFTSKDLEDIHFGLKKNDLLRHYDHVLSGYVAGVGYVEALGKLIRDVKEERHKRGLDFSYTLDPVLGDDGDGFYIPDGQNVAEAYKTYLLPLADIITPNRFEASVLSGLDIDSSSHEVLEQALKACEKLHEQGIKVVVITSFQIKSQEDRLACILSYNTTGTPYRSSELSDRQRPETWIIHVPKLDPPFCGVGDLFAALITAWLRKTDFDLKRSLENTVNSIHAILEDTLAWSKHIEDNSVQGIELRLVQNKRQILSPKIQFEAERIDRNL